jgi:hypothetical protein
MERELAGTIPTSLISRQRDVLRLLDDDSKNVRIESHCDGAESPILRLP